MSVGLSRPDAGYLLINIRGLYCARQTLSKPVLGIIVMSGPVRGMLRA
jgi:hypothetical protein